MLFTATRSQFPDLVQSVVLPLLRFRYSLTVRSQIDLEQLTDPCIFAANHGSHLDSLMILAALPRAQRDRIRIAAAADYWYCSALRRATAALFNGFPFPRSGATGIKRSIALLREGCSILIYPAGTRAPRAHFRRGIGLLAAISHCPVIPTAILGSNIVWPKGQLLPHSGRLTVRFGAPLTIDRSVSPGEATSRIEAAVQALGAG